MHNEKGIIIIGAGIGGLTAGALLLKAGYPVTVLEAQVYPGGSAGTFYHKQYLFDAGATLVGGFEQGQPHYRVAEALDLNWPVAPVDPAWTVHLPNGQQLRQWSNEKKWLEEWTSVFPESEAFWRKQQMLAGISWDITSRDFPWPPRSIQDGLGLVSALRPSTIRALPYLNKKVADIAPPGDRQFTAFLDSQLLISAQTTSARANALYGSAALDLPRRGVYHVRGGTGSLAKTLADWIETNGGKVLYRQEVEAIEVRHRRAAAVRTKKGLHIEADGIIANLTPWTLKNLLADNAPISLQKQVAKTGYTWGAFTLYLGVDAAKIGTEKASHHQVISDLDKPLGEGNSIFISVADSRDHNRAPSGKRPVTISTHTKIEPWWRLYENNRDAYLNKRAEYADKLLTAATSALPGLREAVELSLPGTPVTFDYYTGRHLGMVGGFPQESLFSARGPGTGVKNLWLVGDSIFPGQSTAGVTLGAIRVAAEVTKSLSARPRIVPAALNPSVVGE